MKRASTRKYSGKIMDIVWIHGFGEDSSVWEDFLPAIHSYYTSHVFDHAGFTGYVSIEEYANALRVFLAGKGIEKPVLIGHSMGGYIALEYAARYSDQVHGLGLFHSSAAADSEQKKKERDKTGAFIAQNGTAAFIKNFYPNMFSEGFRQENADFLAQNIRRYSELSPQALVSATESMKNRRDHLETLPTFIFPVFQILGKQDTFVLLEKALEQTALLQQPSALILDTIAHAGMFEAPSLCADFINHWLGSDGA